ncbi:MAG: hypothetical protein V4804_09165 [Pseudomonadota bacterium]|jgi:hypothetical protein
MKFLDPNHPAFRNPVLRWLTCIAPIAWGGFELYTGNPGWALLFIGAGAYAVWMLIIKGPDQG